MKKQYEKPELSVHALVTENVLFELPGINGNLNGFWGAYDSGDMNNYFDD